MATTTLRRTVDVVTGLAAVGLVAFVTFASATQIRERKLVQEVAADLARFRQVLAYKAASKQVEINGRGWPTTVDPEWFGGEPPRNPLVTPERPWVEIAPPDEAELSDPPVRMAISPLHASFWYNPYQGIVRARVPVSISDEKALRLYNAVNGTALANIYAPIPDPAPPVEKPEGEKTETAEAEEPNLDPTAQAPERPEP